MSQYPGPNPYYDQNAQPSPQSQPYAMPGHYSAGGLMPKARPTCVTAVAIIGIILGSLSLLCAGPATILNAWMATNGGKNPMAPGMAALDHSVAVFSVFQTGLNSAMALIMLIGCIAALSLKRFARKMLVIWSFPMIAWAVVVCITTIMWIGPAVQGTLPGSHGPAVAMQSANQIGMAIGAVFTCAFMCAVPACVLLLWTSPNVKAAFGEASPDAPLQSPPGWPPSPRNH